MDIYFSRSSMSGLYAEASAVQIGVTVALSILVVTDLIGNTLVILIILTNKSMKSPMNYLLVNLAVADMIVGVFLTPRFVFSHFFIHPHGLAGRLTCMFLTAGNISWTGAASSIISLLAISCERFTAIMYPHSTKLKLTLPRVKRIVIGSWMFAVVLNIPLFVTVYYDKYINICMEKWPKQHMWLAKAYSTVWFIFAGVIPVAIMFVLYSRVIYSLWFKQNQEQGTQLAVLKSRKRVTKMVVIVSVVYAVCWLPEETVYLLHHYDQPFNNNDVIYNICVVLATFNSAINPFIYTLQSEKFRNCLIRLVCLRRFRRNSVGVEMESFDTGPKTGSRIDQHNHDQGTQEQITTLKE
ncbi:substance-K receptor-like [Actinia tenebrosa]|uniref:Substance-K receptor-like n=1 Tax=Actinia tenebrosa TaxID=6105 RepID=A0A6P8IHT8_ACTTE|nr:substance-K receptor-like [Actinia tenebrosa]